MMSWAQYSRMKMGTACLAAAVVSWCGPLTAAVVVNDTWQDGTRDDPAAPAYSENGVDADTDGDIESAWFLGGSGDLDPVDTGGPLRLTVDETSSSSASTYFTAEGSEVNLANAGDQLKITWVFTPEGVNESHTGQSFRLAVVDSPADLRVDSEATPGSGAYTGYAMFMNMNTTLGNSNSFQLRERDGTDALLSSSSQWNGVANGATTGDGGYTDGTEYTLEMLFTRTAANELEIVATMTGEGVGPNGQGFMTLSHTDAAPASFAFDTFHFRPSRGDETAAQFDSSLFRVEFTPIPEPASVVLFGLGTLGLLGRRPRRG